MSLTAPVRPEEPAFAVIGRAVLVGMVIMLAGTMPRNLFFAANLQVAPVVPWAIPLTAVYLWFFWRFLNGTGDVAPAAAERHAAMRASAVSARVWFWALMTGGFGIIALVFGLEVANRLVALPVQRLPDLGAVPKSTVLALLLAAAPIAGIIEEVAFRGYMQGPIEKRCGLPVAILITGTMFAVAHLDFTAVLWPYYVIVSAIYGVVARYGGSILPAVVLHTAGNLYSNLDLWQHGQAEWQAPAGAHGLVWQTGADAAFWQSSAACVVVTAAAVWAARRLARAATV